MKLIAEKLKPKIPAITFFISIIVAWPVVPSIFSFPMIALFIFFVYLSTFVFLLRKEKTRFDIILYVGVLVLSFFTIYRANPLLQFFDFIFIIFFGSLLILPLTKEHGIFSILLSPLLVIKNTLLTKNIFPYNYKIIKKIAGNNYIPKYIPTLIITVLILAITIPLLASANPFFNAILQIIIKFLNLNWLYNLINTGSITDYIFRLIAISWLLYWIPRIFTVSVHGIKTPEIKKLFSINYVIPKTVMALLLIIFFITQIQLYFASHETLRSMGYTNSRLTNEIFFQVTTVAFIVFLLTYFDNTRKKWNSLLTYFLTFGAFLLVGIAFKSVTDYSTLNGFTHKRLWGYASMTWLTGALMSFIYCYKKRVPHLRFTGQIIIYTMGIVLLINIINFDYLISRVSQPTVAGVIDYRYLSRLSPDGEYYTEILAISTEYAKKENFLDNSKTDTVYNVIKNIEYLKNKYGTQKNIYTFNFAEYKEYLTIKDINTAELSKMIQDTRQQHTRKPQPQN